MSLFVIKAEFQGAPTDKRQEGVTVTWFDTFTVNPKIDAESLTKKYQANGEEPATIPYLVAQEIADKAQGLAEIKAGVLLSMAANGRKVNKAEVYAVSASFAPDFDMV